jgi:hypothetical protein
MSTLQLTLSAADPAPGLHNDDKLVKQILARLKRGPSTADKPGFIYMYKERAKKNDYRKIGRTERLPARRLEEWPGSELVKSWGCKRNRLAEVLIHWLLDGVRVYRYVMAVDKETKAETLVSAWKRTRKLIGREGSISKEMSSRPKHMEWFMASEQTLLKVIQTVVTDINVHWTAEAWPAWMEGIK